MPEVTGTLVLDPHAPPFNGATVYVRLEDVSFADAPARVLAEEVRRDVVCDPRKGGGIRFSLSSTQIDPHVHYAVRAHVDLDGDGSISVGDYINMQSCPVLTFGHPAHVKIPVQRVG
jgi:hypothetical protein